MKNCFICLSLLLILSCKHSTNSNNSSNVGNEEIKLFDILMPEKTGINFENKLPESLTMNGLFYEYFYNGSGVVVADFNNDGLQDVFFISNLYTNKLYLNTGNLKFKDISKECEIDDSEGFPTGVTTVDINCDGWMDIYMCNAGKVANPEFRKNKLWVNQGLNKDGIPTFREESSKYNLDITLCSTQAAFFDYDHDGDLDMFLINHSPIVYAFKDIEKLMHTESSISGDRLYQNQNGKFVDVSKKTGIVNNSLSFGLGIGISDLNNDGWPDIYVSNDYSGKDMLYLNNKNGTFTECIDKALYHLSFSSMGNDLADINNDGWSDIITLEMMAEDNYTMKTSIGMLNKDHFNTLVDLGLHHQYNYNTLQLNNGIFTRDQIPVFSDIARLAGVTSTDWSWGALLFDMDNDGLKDIFIANGIKKDLINEDLASYVNKRMEIYSQTGQMDKKEFIISVLNRMSERRKNNYFFRNNGDLTFEKKNGKWVNDKLTCSNGSTYADFDNDGDMDIILNNSDGPSFIYKNNTSERGLGNYLQFKLIGPKKNPVGIGTKIIVKQTNQIQVLEQYLTRGFMSSVSPVLHFGLGSDKIVPEIQVIWPDGKDQVITNISANQVISMSYSDANQVHNFSYTKPSLFNDVTKSMKLNHKHEENKFNDFSRESLLPHKMSDLGPAMAVGDVNNDGLEDFYIGGAKGYPGKLYIQTNDGFRASGNQPWAEDINCEDVKATFFDADNDGDLDLYVVSGSNEYEEGSPYLQDRLYLNDGSGDFKKMKDALPDMRESGSCVVAGDYDGDSDMDLFVGGRQIPGKYPLPASSHILRNDCKSGKVRFTDVTSEVAPQLNNIGMVTDAVFTDINGDGKLDMVIVGEWMSIRVFKNTGRSFEDITDQTGLSQQTGWWNCVVAADFDHDGNIDLVAGNLGLNFKYKASKKEPFEAYAKDFDNNGKLDIVLGYYNNDTLYPLRGLKSSYIQLPIIKHKFLTFSAFGKATLADVYGAENLKNALNYKANNFATFYFENMGDGTFKVHPLGNLAQISSVNSILAEDVDGDDNLDLIIAGNLYGTEPETPRNDASIGLFLKGNGKGNFEPSPAIKNGLFIDGDVRKISLIHLGKNKNRGIIAAKNNSLMQLIKINDKK
ncbi:MAG TPA: VCBS repeat-containing protein [Bacteroidales bacterium]|nr:VCBS repeat-containing protein [Bacteroidales bacterium]